jgi:hypothetical protein
MWIGSDHARILNGKVTPWQLLRDPTAVYWDDFSHPTLHTKCVMPGFRIVEILILIVRLIATALILQGRN